MKRSSAARSIQNNLLETNVWRAYDKDILSELKTGLDPRSEVTQFEFANIYSIDDVQVGMVVPGVVTNLTRFGAFIDIGVKQDGLVHVRRDFAPLLPTQTGFRSSNDKVQVSARGSIA